MRRNAVLVALLVLPVLAYADDNENIPDHQQMEAAAPNDPPLKITINPEARVSVTLAGRLPPSVPCGTATDLAVRIVNQGFVTAQLEAELVGDVRAGATLDFHPEPLKGVPEELRNLCIRLIEPGSTDLTLSFRTDNNAPDLGGRDRVHFLMHCLPVQ
jgi:hypothetical protein